MSAESKAKIRDRRKPGWFRLDDEIIEDFGPEIGVHGIAVYAALCKHADKEENSHPGLRLLCEKLRIGRKKLLDTLAELERVGLIEIEPGDRKSVSVYTLLDVPKKGSSEREGGSNENQGVVPDRTRGGSQQHQGGGSGQNRNQTHREPNPLEPEGGSVTPLDSVAGRCIALLRKTKGWKYDEARTLALVGELREKYPNADPEKVCDEYEFNIRHGAKVTNYPSTLRTYFRKAHEWASERTAEGGGRVRGRKKQL